MRTRVHRAFIGLIAVQAIHSIEEYRGRLYDVFPPARFMSGLISDDRQRGFVILNVALVTVGIWCALWPVRQDWPSARAVITFWACIEAVNGVGHPLWSAIRVGYTPGVASAPLLLALSSYLAWELWMREGIKG